MKSNSYISGKKAENLAIEYLARNNWNIVKQNYKVEYGEIDIIAYLNNTIVAFEVKTRKNIDFLNYSILNKQKLRIKNAFLLFLSNNLQYSDYNLRFDAIFINKKTSSIEHIVSAWDEDGS